MARRRKRQEHENHERWLISYADFITLLFAFFVVMYSISSVNEGKYKVFSDSLSIAFTNQPTNASQNVVPNQQEQMLKALVDRRTARLGEQQRKLEKRMKDMADGLSGELAQPVQQGLVSVSQTTRGVVIDINANKLFRPGDAELQAGAVEVLHEVALALNREALNVEVEGHTDDVPIRNARFPSNWELSGARASSVVRMLVEQGVAEGRLATVGLASTKPLVPNDSAENRARNRRVSVIIVSPALERE
jgi:chemotaxis protein MotB